MSIEVGTFRCYNKNAVGDVLQTICQNNNYSIDQSEVNNSIAWAYSSEE